jgi:hypothetical protein
LYGRFILAIVQKFVEPFVKDNCRVFLVY